MSTYKGIASFPQVFTAKVAKGATEAKFGITLLIPANDPQIPALQAEVNAAKQNTFPSGYTGTDCCFETYDEKYKGKEYYDPRFSGWWALSSSAKEDDRPKVVNMNYQPVIDPSEVFAGQVVYVNMGISGYTKGRGGIGGWLNGIMITNEEPPMGRLDNKPSVEQMFAGVTGGAAQPHVAANGVAVTAPVPKPPVAPVAKPAAPVLLMKPGLASYDDHIKAGWTDQMLLDAGMATRPSFV